MDALTVAALLQMPTPPRFADANAVDGYYRAHDPGNQRWYLLPFVSTAAIIAVIAFALETAQSHGPRNGPLTRTSENIERVASH